MGKSSSILWLSDIDKEEQGIVGGKAAHLGEMNRAGFPVPNAFVITTHAYFDLLTENKLTAKINDQLSTIHFERPESITQVSTHIKKFIMQAKISEALIKEIYLAYRSLGGIFHNSPVAVRSSGAAEDLPHASCAGQHKTFLNVHGEANLLQKLREAWASLFEPSAMFYRHERKIDHSRIGIAILVQKMVAAEKSGTIFTLNPATNDKQTLVIEAILGLGELLVQGDEIPDQYQVDKKHMEIKHTTISPQQYMLINKNNETKKIAIPQKERDKQKLTANQIMQLALLGKKLEQHFYFPQDIEWAIEKNKIFLLQTRPVTTTHLKQTHAHTPLPSTHLPLILQGDPASPGMITGKAFVVHNEKEAERITKGDILVAPQIHPTYIPAMKNASAIVVDAGGQTPHAVIIARELGIPMIIGATTATKSLRTGDIITVNATKGLVHKGSLPASHAAHAETKISAPTAKKTATRIFANVTNILSVQSVDKNTVDGLLLHGNSILTDIGIHPKKLIKEGEKHMYRDMLTKHLEILCQTFHPLPVIYQLSDLSTDEFRSLKDGKDYEPFEVNPLLGYKGAYRSVQDAEILSTEIDAIRKVRNKKHQSNLHISIPCIRTVEELQTIKHMLGAAEIHRSPHCKIWLGIDIPANIFVLDEFIRTGIDGIFLNVECLATFMLGVDQSNPAMKKAFTITHPAVFWLLEHALAITNKHHLASSLQTQTSPPPPQLLEKVIADGVSSITLSPDDATASRDIIAHVERTLIESKYKHKN